MLANFRRDYGWNWLGNLAFTGKLVFTTTDANRPKVRPPPPFCRRCFCRLSAGCADTDSKMTLSGSCSTRPPCAHPQVSHHCGAEGCLIACTPAPLLQVEALVEALSERHVFFRDQFLGILPRARVETMAAEGYNFWCGGLVELFFRRLVERPAGWGWACA